MAFGGDNITLVNRTSRNLLVRFDGVDYTIVPGENVGFPRAWVKHAKEQNPLMGSQHPFNPAQFVSLVGVKDSKDDCSSLEQSTAPQRIDRSGDKARGKASKVIAGDGPTAWDAQMQGAPTDGFTARP